MLILWPFRQTWPLGSCEFAYIEHIAGYRPLKNQCSDPTSYLPKRDSGVTRPVYNCGQDNCLLGQVPGGLAGRLGAPNFLKGYALPLRPPLFACMECQPSHLKGKTQPQPALNYVISQEDFYQYNCFKMPFFDKDLSV